jgi:hypothetical protein
MPDSRAARRESPAIWRARNLAAARPPTSQESLALTDRKHRHALFADARGAVRRSLERSCKRGADKRGALRFRHVYQNVRTRYLLRPESFPHCIAKASQSPNYNSPRQSFARTQSRPTNSHD